MPTRKGKKQAMTWLRSKAKEEGLEGINAQLCINVIEDLSGQLSEYAKILNRIRSSRLRRLEEEKASHEYQMSIYDLEKDL
jgi:hypothetical protein